MPLSSFEVTMQTMASVFTEYLEEEKGVPAFTKDGLNQLVKEQFPHFEKKETRPGVYAIRIPVPQMKNISGIPDNFQSIEDRVETAFIALLEMLGRPVIFIINDDDFLRN